MERAAIGVGALRDDADALPHALGTVQHVVPGHQRAPGGGRHARGEDADRRRLPGAVGAEQAEELAVAHVQVERFERDDARIGTSRRRAAGRGRPISARSRATLPAHGRGRIHLAQILGGDGLVHGLVDGAS